MPWKIFLVAPTEFCERTLRRYSRREEPCEATGWSYHNIYAVIDERFAAPPGAECGVLKDGYESDPRWPAKCSCGHVFKEDDLWQVNVDRLYSGASDGKLYPLRSFPIGAMWEAPWFAEGTGGRYTGPDGKCWVVRMPGGLDWIVHGPSSDGSKWKVAGTPPAIDVHPSIGCSSYHGHIQNGVITEDADGRNFPGIPRTA